MLQTAVLELSLYQFKNFGDFQIEQTTCINAKIINSEKGLNYYNNGYKQLWP